MRELEEWLTHAEDSEVRQKLKDLRRHLATCFQGRDDLVRQIDLCAKHMNFRARARRQLKGLIVRPGK